MRDNLPWMLPNTAFEWIEANIASGGTILEFGSGEGSKRLAISYSLYSVEHNPEWLNVSGGKYLYAPIKLSDEFNNEIGWYDPLECLLENPSVYVVLGESLIG